MGASATTISLHKAVPGNACVRSTQITGSPLQSTDNNFSAQGTPWQCVRAFHTNNRVASAVDPVICVERTHALPGTALCRGIVVGRLQRRPCYLCGTHARIARGHLV